jgi:hypothetical protein
MIGKSITYASKREVASFGWFFLTEDKETAFRGFLQLEQLAHQKKYQLDDME